MACLVVNLLSVPHSNTQCVPSMEISFGFHPSTWLRAVGGFMWKGRLTFLLLLRNQYSWQKRELTAGVMTS
jgi:hypothetical protein